MYILNEHIYHLLTLLYVVHGLATTARLRVGPLPTVSRCSALIRATQRVRMLVGPVGPASFMGHTLWRRRAGKAHKEECRLRIGMDECVGGQGRAPRGHAAAHCPHPLGS